MKVSMALTVLRNAGHKHIQGFTTGEGRSIGGAEGQQETVLSPDLASIKAV